MKHVLKTVLGVVLMIWSIFSFANDYPVASVSKDGGFVDISLSIAQYENLKNGVQRLVIRNRLEDQKVSFVIELQPKWQVKPIENADANFYWGNAKIVSVGVESDAFLKQIIKLYELKTPISKFKDSIAAQVVGLGNDPRRMESIPVRMKFFLSSNADESLYSEIFIRVDLKNKVLAFDEKDPEYRAPLVRSMGQ